MGMTVNIINPVASPGDHSSLDVNSTGDEMEVKEIATATTHHIRKNNPRYSFRGRVNPTRKNMVMIDAEGTSVSNSPRSCIVTV